MDENLKIYMLRIDKDLHKNLKRAALDKDMTLREFIIKALEQYLEEN